MTSEEIKQTYSMRDILNKCGLPQPNRSGFIQCPFHKGDREASMKIYDKDFNCFGCGANGDIFTFIEMFYGISFKEAFRMLGGGYDPSFKSSLAVYHAKKEKLMREKQEERFRQKRKLGRHKRVAFMDVTGDGKTYTRMTGFTSLSDGKNSTEYSRQYVDEASERSDVVGYAPSMDYEFDLYTNDAVQKKLAMITDDELLGSDAQVTVVVVDLFDEKTGESTTCTARKRDWSVIPDTEGDGTDALIYKGSLKAAGEIIKGTATTTDSWQTCTFTAE